MNYKLWFCSIGGMKTNNILLLKLDSLHDHVKNGFMNYNKVPKRRLCKCVHICILREKRKILLLWTVNFFVRISSWLSQSFTISFIFYLFGFSYSRYLYMSFHCSASITSVSEWNQSWLQYHLKTFFATFQHNLKCQSTAQPTYLNLCHFKIKWDCFSNTQNLQNFKPKKALWLLVLQWIWFDAQLLLLKQ